MLNSGLHVHPHAYEHTLELIHVHASHIHIKTHTCKHIHMHTSQTHTYTHEHIYAYTTYTNKDTYTEIHTYADITQKYICICVIYTYARKDFTHVLLNFFQNSIFNHVS